MKKWTILVIVALAAVLLAMQYLMERKRGPVPGPAGQPAPSEQIGVALPPGATAYELPEAADNYVPEAAGGSAYGSPIYLPFIQSAYKGACEGGSLKDMISTHGSYWGFFARGVAFNLDETNKMYGMLSDYVACSAAARLDISLCDSLPGASQGGAVSVSQESSPNYLCREKTSRLLFEAYLSGNMTDASYCRIGLSTWDKADLDRFSVPDFCAALAKGPAAAEPFLMKAFAPTPPDAKARIAAAFPMSEGDCRKDQDCLVTYGLYSAMKSGRAQACPKSYQPQCRALLDRSTVPCDKLLQDMSRFYCGAVERVKKLSGGFIGLTQDQFKAEIEKTKAARAQEESMRKEMKKLDEEVNKRAKEMLKKK